VAIIGGGCAGIAAAWELSRPHAERFRDPDYPDADYEITVYEQAWRLGGKGASGRDQYGRIREHGIHIWLGFYENAFRMMRECYAEAAKAGMGPTADADKVLPYASVDHAFFPEPHIGVATKYGTGVWKIWSGLLPPTEGLPGTLLDEDTNPFTLQAYLARCLEVSKALIHSILATPSGDASPGAPRPDGRSALDETLDLNFSSFGTLPPSVVIERMAEMLRGAVLTTAAGLLQGVTILETMLRQRDPAPQFTDGVLKFIEALASEARKQLRDFVSIDPEIRLKTQVLDLIMTIMIGLVQDRVLTDPNGLDAINHIDCKKWLLDHGAVAESVDSAFVTGLYDLAFCYHRGNRKQPSLAAGQALRGALRMFFSYRGSIFWRMRGGMGETVFSPLYRVLRRRNVKFRFLRTLKGVTFSGDRHNVRVDTLTLSAEQPAPEERFDDDHPLDHFGCWRHKRPKAAAPAKDVTLVDGKDFDAVVFAMGIEDLKRVCRERLEGLEGQKTIWKQMFDTTETVATQGAQVWMTDDVNKLGWRRGPVLVSALEGPFETWADMTHTLAAEDAWRAHPNAPEAAKHYGSDVKSIAYFCGLLPEAAVNAKTVAGHPESTQDNLDSYVMRNLRRLLTERAYVFWPAVGRHGNALNRLASEDGRPKGTLLDQHCQASFYGSDRYTLAVPGSLQYRISPLKRLVMNMTIAGDWTECGFNEGCIEAAVMSGMLAANAISGSPNTNNIIGYHHP